MTLIGTVLSGCVISKRNHVAQYNEIPRLLAHPQFQAAAKAAPEFVNDALTTVGQLQYELNR